ncbi:histidine phosphatase family protein [Glaciihabitans sp. dw_435]|uniref:histidine phosphatase family protein n=1 Tax=Glaciihabitans sp. dw_435 TaxID=2720081 RepID=UPI001BD222D9|nr:histidine phosphatase family protein [Glaciihabitans sp. dw_435]
MGATELWLVRHGESVANVAAAAAAARGEDVIEVDQRDADVVLSPVGERQALALGDWLAENTTDARPGAVWSSSYMRAQQTVILAMQRAGLDLPLRVDDRLRDRELGILDLLTSDGVKNRYPEEAARRAWLGKFYYRPPGGESWADVALRLRSFLRDIDLYDEPGTVLVAAHDAVIMIFLYVCNRLSERELLDFALTHTVTNASVTRLVRPSGEGPWQLGVFSDDAHVRASEAPVTEHSGDDDDKSH